jgi:hypothetical protein
MKLKGRRQSDNIEIPPKDYFGTSVSKPKYDYSKPGGLAQSWRDERQDKERGKRMGLGGQQDAVRGDPPKEKWQRKTSY